MDGHMDGRTQRLTRAINKDSIWKTWGPKLEKTNRWSLGYSKMDQQTNERTDISEPFMGCDMMKSN